MQIHTDIIYSNKQQVERIILQKKSGLYNVLLGEGEVIFLQKITSIGVKTMDLKWHSRISAYVALVKSVTQDSTVLF